MKVLFLCNKSPWPPKEGGPMAMNMFIEGLLQTGHEVKVIAVNSYKYDIRLSDIPEGYRRQTAIELIDVNLQLNPLHALSNLVRGKSYHVTRFDSPEFRKRLTEVLKTEKFDIVQLETLFVAPYISTIRAHSSARIVLRAHNIEHLVWQRIASETKNRLKRWYIGRLAGSLQRFEEEVAAMVDGIIPITSKDAEYFEHLNNSIRVTAIPFGVDAGRYDRPGAVVEVPSLFSIGSMNWIPNQEGIRWFLDQVWPDISAQYPFLKYYLAGRCMPDWMKKIDKPNVVVVGEVENATDFIASKSVMIVPLFSGSGIRIKIIEGMASGKVVISTSLGAEGIDYSVFKNILIADAPCEFFEMVSLCINEPESSLKIGQAARELIRTEYSSSGLIQKLVAFYEHLCR